MRAASVFTAMILLFASCGGEVPSSVTAEETGVFNAETLTDGNYGGYRYHEYQLTAGALDVVKVSIEAEGFQGSEAYPPQPFHGGNAPHDFRQGDGAVLSVQAEVNAGEHHFGTARSRDLFNFGEDVAGIPAYGKPPDIRNGAVGTEMVAPVLDLHEGPGMKERPAQEQSVPFP